MSGPTPVDPRDDAALLEAFREGDSGALAVLFDRHAGTVLAFARRFGADADLAEDVVQDCFRDLIDRIDRFELRGQLSSWFYTVARRRTLRLREQAHRNQGSGDEALSVPDPGESDTTGDLRRLLRRLPAGQREVLVMRFLDGFDLASIAEALDLPVGTVKSRLHTALAALRDDPACRQYFGREEI